MPRGPMHPKYLRSRSFAPTADSADLIGSIPRLFHHFFIKAIASQTFTITSWGGSSRSYSTGSQLKSNRLKPYIHLQNQINQNGSPLKRPKKPRPALKAAPLPAPEIQWPVPRAHLRTGQR